MATKKQREAEERRRKVIALVTGSEVVMRQIEAARAARARGEPLIPGEQVRAEARARRKRA